MSRRACSQCIALHDSYDMVEARLEMRTLDGKENRYRTVKLTELCRDCAAALVAKVRPEGLNPDQLDLFKQAPERLVETLSLP